MFDSRARRRLPGPCDLMTDGETHGSGQKILLRENVAETAVILDEVSEEFVQSALEYILDGGMFEPPHDLPGVALPRALLAVSLADLVKEAHERVVAGKQRARHFGFEDEKIGDQPGLHALAVNPAIGGKRGDRAQQRGPLVVIERAADRLRFRQK